MKFFLDFQPEKASFDISYRDQIFSLGSCFSENIGSKLLELGWKGVSNPFGLLYNPASIAEIVNWIEKGELDPEELFEHRGLWRHWLCHTSLAHPSKEQAIENVQNALIQGKQGWENADVLILTLGSSYAWYRHEAEQLVSNCHQMPRDDFAREFLGIDEMFQQLVSVIQGFKNGKENRRVVLTVSPIRYLRDGLIASNRSKARLIEVVQCIAAQIENLYYFPAYEVIIDQLRDYRFYGKDMVHPSQEAIEFVWEQFSRNFSTETKQFVKEAEKLRRMFQHRVLNPDSEQGKAFLVKREEALRSFERRFW